jgi:hypothetical protein
MFLPLMMPLAQPSNKHVSSLLMLPIWPSLVCSMCFRVQYILLA